MKKIVAVLDVESMGLYGRAFSYGIVIGDLNGNVIEEIYKYSEGDYKLGIYEASENDVLWIEKNVKPSLEESNCYFSRKEFYQDWLRIKKEYDCDLFADVPFPVETNFISAIVFQYIIAENIEVFEFSPYPLLDVTSFRIAKGLPEYFDRLPNELPIHNALNDARQSYRGLIEALKA